MLSTTSNPSLECKKYMELFIRIGIPTKLNQYSKMQIRSININGYNQRIFRYVNFIIPCI